jgi:hypothetical protein
VWIGKKTIWQCALIKHAKMLWQFIYGSFHHCSSTWQEPALNNGKKKVSQDLAVSNDSNMNLAKAVVEFMDLAL